MHRYKWIITAFLVITAPAFSYAMEQNRTELSTLGMRHFKGLGIERSTSKAFELFEKAITLGDSRQLVGCFVENSLDLNGKTENGSMAHDAIIFNAPSLLFFLCRQGINKELANSDGDTPLHLAIRLKKVQCVRVLLGEPLLIKDATNNKGETPLHIAIENGDAQLAQLLLAAGANPDAFLINPESKKVQSPLYLATWANQPPIVKLLLEYGADKDLPSDNGCMALHIAAHRYDDGIPAEGLTEIAQILLHAGCDVHARNDFENTPLHYACKRNHKEISELLLEAGADINAKGEHGFTALHYAYAMELQGIIDLLIHKGAKADIVDDNGNVAHNYPAALPAAGRATQVRQVADMAGLQANSVFVRAIISKEQKIVTMAHELIDLSQIRGLDRDLQEKIFRIAFRDQNPAFECMLKEDFLLSQGVLFSIGTLLKTGRKILALRLLRSWLTANQRINAFYNYFFKQNLFRRRIKDLVTEWVVTDSIGVNIRIACGMLASTNGNNWLAAHFMKDNSFLEKETPDNHDLSTLIAHTHALLDRHKNRSLDQAVREKDYDLLEMLLQNASEFDKGRLFIANAEEEGDLKLADLFLEAGVSSFSMDQAFIGATSHNNATFITFLLSRAEIEADTKIRASQIARLLRYDKLQKTIEGFLQ